ncbi:hypothetical protein G7046_g9766 [Stylonectria norvegica]|nr:hypothetical protein G7046_g9766 [Stylonectria norvegica]
MAREKRKVPAAVAGGPKERHTRSRRTQFDPKAPVPSGFVAKPAIPKLKHHSYFEFVDNKNKKKKLEFEVTTRKTPPPGFEFIPIGNPELTTACKELSRDKDAMIFIVSNSKETDWNPLAHHVHRIGHHFREVIVDEAREILGQTQALESIQVSGHSPEPIPESQEEYNVQVDAALRDLFPRIPNTDRQMIIEHAFRRGTTFKGDKPVGLSTDITLARRVQLAVLAHIRHTHTRYDTLLKETSWQNARKVVEALCLDTLVKWRGDEETGRDQLDEILREVVVISDSEEEESEQDTDETSFEEIEPPPWALVPGRNTHNTPGQAGPGRPLSPMPTQIQTGHLAPAISKGNITKKKGKNPPNKKGKKGFKRYDAWQEAIRRNREQQDPGVQPSQPLPLDQHANYGLGPFAQPLPRTSTSNAFNDAQHGSAFGVPGEQAGPAPNENGYVAHHPPAFHSRPLLNPAPHSYSFSPRQPLYEKVMSPGYGLSRNVATTHRSTPVVTSSLQDMLVRSIEPASPNAMKPSFVRTIPPRSQGYRDLSPVRSNLQSSRTRLPLRGAILRDEPAQSSRRVVSDHHAVGSRNPGSYGNQPQNSRLPHEQDYASTHDGYPISSTPVYRSDAQSRNLQCFSTMLPPRMLPHAKSPRPGERSNPILMEDRGGFFERIPSHPDGHQQFPRNAEVVEVRQGHGPHRIVSGEEGSRILSESGGNAGYEVIPIVRPHHSSLETRPRPMLANPPSFRQSPIRVAHGMNMDWESNDVHRRTPGVEARAMSGEHMSPRYQMHGDVRHNDRHNTAPGDIDELTLRYRQDLHVENHYDQRRYPFHPPPPGNVIVLD